MHPIPESGAASNRRRGISVGPEMLIDGRSCLDLAQQFQAVESTIRTVKRALIHDHMEHCIADAVSKSGMTSSRRCGNSNSSPNISEELPDAVASDLPPPTAMRGSSFQPRSLLGALHGLEPGHSKTMMAAFIIAIRGTVRQAVLLGVSAAISHSAMVW